jgi:SAM-dependent MidA family methyltransferase
MEKINRDQGEKLRSFVLSQIKEKGPVPFSRFMEWCLYHEEQGYYRSERPKIGKDGDYFTGPCVHSLFGHLIGKQLSQMAEILGEGTFDLCEMGGGRGFLSEDILDWAKKKASPFYHILRYHLLELSPSFLREQKKRLSEYEREGKVFWMDPKDFRKGKVEIQGCIISNELVDAFPVHRVIQDHGELKEIYVTQRNGQFEELWDKPSDPRINDYFRSMDITLQDGQKAEVHLQALDWMEKVGRSLKRGFVLTIDYGHFSEELYAPHRQEGTLLCYHHHQTSENPYERLGEQDITSHVNFSSLIRKGEEVGLSLTGFVPQYRFLIGLGLLEEMESLSREMSEIDGLKLRLALKHLIEPEVGMGQTFKVLIQHKGVENPQLDGLRDFRSMMKG